MTGRIENITSLLVSACHSLTAMLCMFMRQQMIFLCPKSVIFFYNNHSFSDEFG
jgi:hypothetical protein